MFDNEFINDEKFFHFFREPPKIGVVDSGGLAGIFLFFDPSPALPYEQGREFRAARN